jgi:hypothetical protein
MRACVRSDNLSDLTGNLASPAYDLALTLYPTFCDDHAAPMLRIYITRSRGFLVAVGEIFDRSGPDGSYLWLTVDVGFGEVKARLRCRPGQEDVYDIIRD